MSLNHWLYRSLRIVYTRIAEYGWMDRLNYTSWYAFPKDQVTVYLADTHTASLLLYVSTWAILDKKTQG
jgi:hypothetical protein